MEPLFGRAGILCPPCPPFGVEYYIYNIKYVVISFVDNNSLAG